MLAMDSSTRILKAPFAQWFEYVASGGLQIPDSLQGNPLVAEGLQQAVFVSPVGDPDVMAGNGTLGLEIMEQTRDMVDTVVVPWGGGTLCLGVAIALKTVNPSVKVRLLCSLSLPGAQMLPGAGLCASTTGCVQVLSAEPETACPMALSMAASKPVAAEYKPSFIDGCGSTRVLPEAWHLAQKLLDGALVASVAGTACVVKKLAQMHRVVAEGAGAVPLAAVMENTAHPCIKGKHVVCIVSGGNIDAALLAHFLSCSESDLAKEYGTCQAAACPIDGTA